MILDYLVVLFKLFYWVGHISLEVCPRLAWLHHRSWQVADIIEAFMFIHKKFLFQHLLSLPTLVTLDLVMDLFNREWMINYPLRGHLGLLKQEFSPTDFVIEGFINTVGA